MKAIAHQDQAWEVWREGVQSRMLVSAQNGATRLCIFEQQVAPGTGAPTHCHPFEEVLIVLAGEAEVWIADSRVRLSAGGSVIVPAQCYHGFRNSGTGTLHVHAILASPFFEALFENASEPVRRWVI